MAFVDGMGLWCRGLIVQLLQRLNKKLLIRQLEQSCLKKGKEAKQSMTLFIKKYISLDLLIP